MSRTAFEIFTQILEKSVKQFKKNCNSNCSVDENNVSIRSRRII